jgi:hypothetical protein
LLQRRHQLTFASRARRQRAKSGGQTFDDAAEWEAALPDRRQAISSRITTLIAPAAGIPSSAPMTPPSSAPAATLTAIARGES